MRLRDPKTTALIFASGKMVCTGAKTEENSKFAAKKFARIIQNLGFNVKFNEFKIQNIVGSCDVLFPIKLDQLALEEKPDRNKPGGIPKPTKGTHADKRTSYSTYEPELFPGLIYRMYDPKVVLLIFVSGKLVLTGAKSREDIERALSNIYPLLWEDKKAKK